MLFESSQFADDVSSPLKQITQHTTMFPASSDSMSSYSVDSMPISVSTGPAVATNTTASSVAESATAAQQGISSGQDNSSVSKDSMAGTASSGGRHSTKSSHRKRARATSEQVNVLESVFVVNRSPASRLREDLAARLGMAPRQVQVWFQNRRAKEKTQQRNPRALQQQQHPTMILDPMVYANMNPEFYSMAMASSFMPGSANPDPSAAMTAATNPAFGTSPVALNFGAASGVSHPQSVMQNQQHQQHHALLDNQVAFSAAAAVANAASGAAASSTATNSSSSNHNNPWMNWGGDFAAHNNQYHHYHHQQQQGHISPSLNHYLSMASGAAGMFSPTHINMPNGGLHMGGPAGSGGQPYSDERLLLAASAEKTDAGLCSSGGVASAAGPTVSASATSASAAAAALAHAINITDSRRESEVSAITAVASPTGPGSASMASDSVAASASSVTSPVTTPVVAAETAGAATLVSAAITPLAAPAEDATPRSAAPTQDASAASSGSHDPGQTDGMGAKAQADGDGNGDGTPSGRATPASSSRMAASVRRPAPLALVAHHPSMHIGHGVPLGSNGMPMGIPAGGMPMSNRMGMPFSSFIPDIASYMVLDATRLTVGNWHRVPMPETELTCLACVEPPPLKPVQRPGNHRPAELDSLVGEFQWIISSQGVRYKMVLPYSTISRIKFRETPDTAASLVDASAETVVNPQAALSLLNCALKNPNAKGELSIHVYDLPTFYYQHDSGEWKDIADFSENLCASNTYVHTISGSFVTLFCQLRILLATCSRLKIAGDPLMALWLGNMDDPYSAIAGIPHNTWLPCGDAVCLHSVKRNANASNSSGFNGGVVGGQPANMSGDAANAVNANEELGGLVTSPLSHGATGGSAAMLSGALPAFNMYIPTSAASSTIGTLTPTPTSMTGSHLYNPQMGNMPPALGSARHSLFTFHDANHPAAAAAAAAAAAYHSNLAAAMAGGVGQLPLKTQRSASLPFIRPAGSNGNANTVKVAPAPGSSRLNSPQMSPSPFWYAHNLRRASRDSLSASYNHHPHPMPINQPTTPQGGTGFPNGTFVRRESDAELALAMNNAFSSGDVLGSHRGLSELYGLPVVPPSPLSNVTMASMMNAGSRPGESLEMQVDSGEIGSGHGNQSAADAASKGTAKDAGAGMSNADIVMAIFNAMNSTATIPTVSAAMSTVNANGMLAANQAFLSGGVMPAMTATTTTTTPMSMDGGFGSEAGSGSGSLGFDPSAFMLPQTTDGSMNGEKLVAAANGNGGVAGAQAMDWCFDWSLPATAPVQHGLVGPAELHTPANISASYDGDNEPSNECESKMNIDWSSNSKAATTTASEAI
ncbi:hypothetical protein GGF39_004049 [Coemansia sp. RSA 1721]|nr:hypothetical protein GGF39_004049 [Coemansia sp. RSA 1721]